MAQDPNPGRAFFVVAVLNRAYTKHTSLTRIRVRRAGLVGIRSAPTPPARLYYKDLTRYCR